MVLFFSITDKRNSPAFVTPWSLIHFMFGVLFYLYFEYLFPNVSALNMFVVLIIVHTLYEITDLLYYFNLNLKGQYWSSNSLLNSVGDTIFTILGFILVAIWKPKMSLFQINLLTCVCLVVIVTFSRFKLS